MSEITMDRANPAVAPDAAGLDERLEAHRIELTGYCYRMLGSAFEAEDAVQETFIRAWRGFDRFEGRAKLRSWLYRIATNVCLDMRGASQRRARPVDLSPAGTPSRGSGRPWPKRHGSSPCRTTGPSRPAATRPTSPSLASRSGSRSWPPSSTCLRASEPC